MNCSQGARRALGLLGLGVLLAVGARAQAPADTARAAPAPVQAVAAVPQAAPDTVLAPGRVLRRALLVPGWGQVSNGQPARAGVAVAALAGAGVVLGLQQRETIRLRRVALVAGCVQVPDRPPCADLERARPAFDAAGRPGFPQAAAARDAARGRRDLAGLGVGLVYAVQALDAFVGAHLLGFDVSDDLSLRLEPRARGLAWAARVQL